MVNWFLFQKRTISELPNWKWRLIRLMLLGILFIFHCRFLLRLCWDLWHLWHFVHHFWSCQNFRPWLYLQQRSSMGINYHKLRAVGSLKLIEIASKPTWPLLLSISRTSHKRDLPPKTCIQKVSVCGKVARINSLRFVLGCSTMGSTCCSTILDETG